jgi:hypothetical protein
MFYKSFTARTSDGLIRERFRTLHQSESWLGQHLFQNGQPRKSVAGQIVTGLIVCAAIELPVLDAEPLGLEKLPDEVEGRMLFAYKYKAGFIPNVYDDRIQMPRALRVEAAQ